MPEIWELTATELASRIRAKALSAREAAQAALHRLEAVNLLINAVVDCRPEDVLRQAGAIDQALRAVRTPGRWPACRSR